MGSVKGIGSFVLGLLLAAAIAAPAHAIRCNAWGKMEDEQKRETVDRMISNAVGGSDGRSYRIDRGAVGRCLESRAQSIEYDFDGACSDSRTAGMQALNRIFKDYIWGCAG